MKIYFIFGLILLSVFLGVKRTKKEVLHCGFCQAVIQNDSCNFCLGNQDTLIYEVNNESRPD